MGWDFTLTDAVALEPGARGIPHKLLPVFLDGYVEGVTDIWVVEVSHTQDLGDKMVRTASQNTPKCFLHFVWDQTEISPFKHLDTEIQKLVVRNVDMWFTKEKKN